MMPVEMTIQMCYLLAKEENCFIVMYYFKSLYDIGFTV